MFNISLKTILINLFLIVIGIGMSILIYNQYSIDNNLSNIDLDKAKKLMIVAHPDDETLWGGAHLLEDDYLVVCITCGLNKTRRIEFEKVMKETDDQYVMLGYPDKVLGIRSDWKEEKNQIYNDLKQIIELKDWELIVTHNKDGEYGHIHHKKTHNIVLDVYNDLNKECPLYFYGKYYTKGNLAKLDKKPDEIDSALYKKKVDNLIKIYKSQDFINDKFDQMFPYEDWIKYENEIAKD